MLGVGALAAPSTAEARDSRVVIVTPNFALRVGDRDRDRDYRRFDDYKRYDRRDFKYRDRDRRSYRSDYRYRDYDRGRRSYRDYDRHRGRGRGYRCD